MMDGFFIFWGFCFLGFARREPPRWDWTVCCSRGPRLLRPRRGFLGILALKVRCSSISRKTAKNSGVYICRACLQQISWPLRTVSSLPCFLFFLFVFGFFGFFRFFLCFPWNQGYNKKLYNISPRFLARCTFIVLLCCCCCCLFVALLPYSFCFFSCRQCHNTNIATSFVWYPSFFFHHHCC